MILFSKLCALVLSVIAAGSDLRTTRISNDLLICFLSAAVSYRIILLDPQAFAEGITGLIIPFLLLWIFFRTGKMGAGDIKLFCVLGMFMGPSDILWCMLCSFVCGGAVSVMDLFVYEKRSSAGFSKINVAVLTVPAVAMWTGGLYG